MRVWLVVFALLGLGCNSMDDGYPTGPLGGVGATNNALGQLCAQNVPCPQNHQCVFLSTGNGQGYCSPVCTTDTQCRDGYTGPQSGGLTCFTPQNPSACSITCQSDADCPASLGCKTPAGAPLRFCAPR